MHTRRPTHLIGTLLLATSLGCGGGASNETPSAPSTVSDPRAEPRAEPQAEPTTRPTAGEAGDRPAPTAGEVREARQAQVEADNRFSVELYRAVADAHTNQIASPYSVATALAMLREGARGESRDELSRALHLEGDVASGQGALASRIDAIGQSGVTLRVANRIFVDESLHVLDAFRDALAERYHAPLEALDFRGAPEPARQHINAWIAEQTNDRIRDLLAPRTIGPDTRLVLTNAVYFHGQWATPFDPARTTPLPFHVDGRTEVAVPTMRGTRRLAIAQEDGVTVAELPYVGDALAMVVVVPDAQDGLPALLASLDEGALTRWTSSLHERGDVQVALPRFRVAPTESLDLGRPLHRLGVTRIFEPGQADLTGITAEQPRPFVGAVIHRAFVEVNEEGTEAAAATAIIMREGAARRPELIVDRPFLFFIRDVESGLVLFLGHVVDPRADAS